MSQSRFGDKLPQKLTGLFPKRDCGPERNFQQINNDNGFYVRIYCFPVNFQPALSWGACLSAGVLHHIRLLYNRQQVLQYQVAYCCLHSTFFAHSSNETTTTTVEIDLTEAGTVRPHTPPRPVAALLRLLLFNRATYDYYCSTFLVRARNHQTKKSRGGNRSAVREGRVNQNTENKMYFLAEDGEKQTKTPRRIHKKKNARQNTAQQGPAQFWRTEHGRIYYAVLVKIAPTRNTKEKKRKNSEALHNTIPCTYHNSVCCTPCNTTKFP